MNKNDKSKIKSLNLETNDKGKDFQTKRVNLVRNWEKGKFRNKTGGFGNFETKCENFWINVENGKLADLRINKKN